MWRRMWKSIFRRCRIQKSLKAIQGAGQRNAAARPLCRLTTTFDPDTLQQDRGVLRKIVKQANSRLALDCTVAEPGILHQGDPITHSS